MTLGFDDMVSTSTGAASTAEFQLNNAAALTTPNIANGIVEVIPYHFAQGAYTTDESAAIAMRISSFDVSMDPCRFNLPIITGGDTAFVSVGFPALTAYGLNTPLAEQSRIDYFGQAQIANTVLEEVGATVVYTDSGVGQQQFFQKPDNEGVSVAAINSRATGNQITITGGSQINQLMGFFFSNATAGDVATDIHWAGVYEFSSSDFDTPFPYRIGGLQLLAGGEAAASVMGSGITRMMLAGGNGIPISSRTTIDTFYTNRDATANVMNFIHNVGFVK